MTNSDYKRVEADLQAQLQPLSHLQGGGLQHLHGWSTASIGGDDSDNDFEPQTLGGEMGDSILSTATSLESIISTASSQTTSSRSSRQTQAYLRRRDSDVITEIWHLELRIASVVMILLHEDSLIPSADPGHPLTTSSIRTTIERSKYFFSQLTATNLASYGGNNFTKGLPILDKACSSNHLRLLAAPVQLECTQQASNNITAMIGGTTAARFELLECLLSDKVTKTNTNSNDIEKIDLLSFNNEKSASQSSKPNLIFTFKQSQRFVRTFQGRKRAVKTKLR